MGQSAQNLAESLARLVDSAVGYGRSTVETARASLEAEQRQRASLLLSACALFLLLTLGALFAGAAIVLAFRDTNPALAAAAVAGGFMLLAVVAAWCMARTFRQRPSAAVWIASMLAVLVQYLRAGR